MPVSCDLLITNSTKQNLSSKPDSYLSSQEILGVLWNTKVHYRVHKSPPPVPILSHMNPVHILKIYYLQTNFNVILPSTPMCPKWPLPLDFSV
jgi:hypothetical protein